MDVEALKGIYVKFVVCFELYHLSDTMIEDQSNDRYHFQLLLKASLRQTDPICYSI